MNVRLPSLMGKNCLTASASRLGYSLGLVGVRRHCQRRCRRNDLERRESLPHQVIATDRFPLHSSERNPVSLVRVSQHFFRFPAC